MLRTDLYALRTSRHEVVRVNCRIGSDVGKIARSRTHGGKEIGSIRRREWIRDRRGSGREVLTEVAVESVRLIDGRGRKVGLVRGGGSELQCVQRIKKESVTAMDQ